MFVIVLNTKEGIYLFYYLNTTGKIIWFLIFLLISECSDRKIPRTCDVKDRQLKVVKTYKRQWPATTKSLKNMDKNRSYIHRHPFLTKWYLSILVDGFYLFFNTIVKWVDQIKIIRSLEIEEVLEKL